MVTKLSPFSSVVLLSLVLAKKLMVTKHNSNNVKWNKESCSSEKIDGNKTWC